MARARNIKPGLYKNEDLAECSIWARYIFPGLWTLADREGRLEDRPKRIKGELLPYDGQDVDKLLQELHDRGFLLRYRNVDGVFIQISNFSKHQSPHYSEKPSVIKPPTLPEKSAEEAEQKPRAAPDNSGSEGPIKRGSQPPDSLIPDSPTADSGLSDSPNPGGSSNATAPTRAQPQSRAAALAVLIRNLEKQRGKAPKITSTQPIVQGWAEQGVTDAQLTEAYEIAVADRIAAGDDAPINAGFLDIFLEKLLNPGTATTRVNGHRKPWYAATWQDIVAKGEEKGLKESDYDSPPAFKSAVLKAHGVTLDQVRQAEKEWA